MAKFSAKSKNSFFSSWKGYCVEFAIWTQNLTWIRTRHSFKDLDRILTCKYFWIHPDPQQLFWMSRSACPVQPVPFCCLVLPVLFCLSCLPVQSACHVLPFLFSLSFLPVPFCLFRLHVPLCLSRSAFLLCLSCTFSVLPVQFCLLWSSCHVSNSAKVKFKKEDISAT